MGKVRFEVEDGRSVDRFYRWTWGGGAAGFGVRIRKRLAVKKKDKKRGTVTRGETC